MKKFKTGDIVKCIETIESFREEFPINGRIYEVRDSNIEYSVIDKTYVEWLSLVGINNNDEPQWRYDCFIKTKQLDFEKQLLDLIK